ncbi:MAG: hypothetical protein KDC24_11180, partial [Saprospiraceae bacterium]|nr:hypothetical protein [Saprospiraceae bacterium]
GVNANMSKGAYPYEFDFAINVQTTIQNGQFQENLSDIDVSFDFHPIVPDINKEMERTDGKRRDGLWLESFAFVKRFNNSFLGIEQRYETGVGFIFNFFSKNKLTRTGIANRKAMEEIPKYDVYGDDLARCLEECYVKKSILQLSQFEAQAISNTRERYQRSNFKKYSKWRTGLLVGVYYELEDALAANEILLNGETTQLTVDFEATNKIRLELRPIFSFQPKDGYKLKIYPYFKLPVGAPNSVVVSPEGVRDVRYDWFLDAQSSFDIRLEDGFSISFLYRLFYDNAPKRAFVQQNDGTYTLLVGQKVHSNFGVAFNFGF